MQPSFIAQEAIRVLEEPVTLADECLCPVLIQALRRFSKQIVPARRKENKNCFTRCVQY